MISTYIQPLMRVGKQMDLKGILHQVNSRRPKLVQQIGTQQVLHMFQQVLDFSQ